MVAESRYSFSETVRRLQQAVADAGNTVFATLDQAEAAARVGSTLRPTTLILFGNPRAGTPLMDAYPLVALELPLKFLVWEADGRVHIARTSMAEVAERYAIPPDDPRIIAMDALLERLGDSVAVPGSASTRI